MSVKSTSREPAIRRPFFRTAIERDWVRLLEIEEAAFPLAPWSYGEMFESDGNTFAICLLPGMDDVVGYITTRRNAWAIEVLSLAIDPKHTLCGLGRLALDFAVPMAPRYSPLKGDKREPARECMAWVWERSLSAQKFFRACGFTAKKTVRNFYDSEVAGDDAAILFTRPIVDRFSAVRIAD
jgi:ribosomal protein S18 acetylase RimI-like enzyme